MGVGLASNFSVIVKFDFLKRVEFTPVVVELVYVGIDAHGS